MSTSNIEISAAGTRLIQALESFLDDADSITEKEKLKGHLTNMKTALATFKERQPKAHSATAGLC